MSDACPHSNGLAGWQGNQWAGVGQAARDDTVHMRVMRHRRAPGVQYQGGAHARTQVLRVSGDDLQRCGDSLEQEGVDHRLIVIDQVTNRRWQGKDQVVILD